MDEEKDEVPCPDCGSGLKFIVHDDFSDYYRCGHCHCVWDFIDDGSEADIINVTENLAMMKRKKVAS